MKRILLPILLLVFSCEEVLESIKEGCTTATACNYDVTAMKDNGNCISPQGCNNWCDGDTTIVLELDCIGECGGVAAIDSCSVCSGGTTNFTPCIQDCLGAWGGTAVADSCGTCDTNTSNNCAQDCLGIWGGDAIEDNCGTCDSDTNNDCDADCAGIFGGDAVVDCAGTCNGSAVIGGCDNQCGSTLKLDECGVCGGSGIPNNACDCDGNIEDCLGECGGSAELDECGVCEGSGIPNGECDCSGTELDCKGNCGGEAFIDSDGYCCISVTNSDYECDAVYEYVSLGSDSYCTNSCGSMNGQYCENSSDCYFNNGFSGGCNDGRQCIRTELQWTGEMDCDWVDTIETNCGSSCADNQGDCGEDCFGIVGGNAAEDNCGTCDADSSNDCVQDCAGVWGGDADYDNCGDCIGGDTGETACVQDCNDDWGGSTIVDACGNCVGGDTGESACASDIAYFGAGGFFLTNSEYGGIYKQTISLPASINSLSKSHDGQWFAGGTTHNGIIQIKHDGSEIIAPSLGSWGSYSKPVYGQNNQYIYYTSYSSTGTGQQSIVRMSKDGENSDTICNDCRSGFSVSPDGSRILMRNYYDLYLEDESNHLGNLGFDSFETPSWFPNNQDILLFGRQNENDPYLVYKYNINNMSITFALTASGSYHSLTISPDGTQFVALENQGKIVVYPTDGSLSRSEIYDFGGGVNVMPLYWNEDGDKILFNNTYDGENNLYLINVDGSGLQQLTTSGGILWYAF